MKLKRFRPKYRRKQRQLENTPGEQEVFHYMRRPFIMSPIEYELYKILVELVGERYLVFPQMQLSAIFEARYNRGKRFMDALRHINQKSCDYVVCDLETTRPILIIELDGWSHKLAYRQRRDQEVNRIAEESGVRILHLSNLEGLSHDELMNSLRSALPLLD